MGKYAQTVDRISLWQKAGIFKLNYIYIGTPNPFEVCNFKTMIDS